MADGGFGGLFGGIQSIGFIGLFAAFLLVVLSKLGATTSLGATASKAINDTMTAIATVPTDWLGILILILVMGVAMYFLFRAFASGGTR